MAVTFSEEQLNKVIGVLTNTPDEIETQYIKPCSTTLRECGLEADLQAGINAAADELEANFRNDLAQFTVIRDNLLSYSEDLKKAYELAQAKINALKDKAGSATKLQTEQRGHKLAY